MGIGTKDQMERNRQLVLYTGTDANRTYSRNLAKWRDALDRAKAITAGVAPSSLRLEHVLSRTPSLPERIPRNEDDTLKGYSVWSGRVDNDCPCTRKCEPDEVCLLGTKHPVICTISTTSNFATWDGTRHNGIALLVLGWAYVLTADLAERRGQELEYLDQPRVDRGGDPTLQLVRLDYATARERVWWNRLLGDLAYGVKGEQASPWTVQTENFGVFFADNNGNTATDSPPTPPPSAREAAVFVSRFCRSLGLGSQCTAALAVALTLPLRSSAKRSASVTIELPALCLPEAVGPAGEFVIDDAAVAVQPPPEFALLGRFMALSINPLIFGPALWSAFWAPGVPCNYSAAWTRAVHRILEPILSAGDLALFAKVMACISEDLAPLWLGMALGGSSGMANKVLTYLADVVPYPAARPSMTAAAWTGVPNSFLDVHPPGPHVRPNGCVSRAQVWRLRHDFHTVYEDGPTNFPRMPPLGWPPFGTMREEDVELELRRHLRCNHQWTYEGWTWRPGTDVDKGLPDLSGARTKARSTVAIPRRARTVRIPHKHLKSIRTASKTVTEHIFWWANSQVEKGMGGTIVQPIPSGRQTADAGGSPTRPASFNPERIRAWRDDVVQKNWAARH
ncbi:hypothetical protein SPI_02729 [Niveomyces insectorum RCEF 264]|uniref:Uncharacterized protein n=1 Tax=Niveomyces insectorum RCEF 264 TaxID=1081102 RepID=A0A162JA63_9HYPO|nr:hypothetical protein SPI_02729 [Niveomyces insectorum RCEF 264]